METLERPMAKGIHGGQAYKREPLSSEQQKKIKPNLKAWRKLKARLQDFEKHPPPSRSAKRPGSLNVRNH